MRDQCVRKGQAAGIKNKDGVYTIVGAYTENKNEKVIPFVAKNVTAKGTVSKDKDGKLTIDVASMAKRSRETRPEGSKAKGKSSLKAGERDALRV